MRRMYITVSLAEVMTAILKKEVDSEELANAQEEVRQREIECIRQDLINFLNDPLLPLICLFLKALGEGISLGSDDGDEFHLFAETGITKIPQGTYKPEDSIAGKALDLAEVASAFHRTFPDMLPSERIWDHIEAMCTQNK